MLIRTGFLKIQIHCFAEGGEGEFGEFEVLLAEGDANDDDVEQYAENDMHQAGKEASADKPDDVERDADATRRARCASNFRTKGEEAEKANLEGLPCHGNADDGTCHCQTACKVTDGGFESSENPPDNGAKEVHVLRDIWGY